MAREEREEREKRREEKEEGEKRRRKRAAGQRRDPGRERSCSFSCSLCHLVLISVCCILYNVLPMNSLFLLTVSLTVFYSTLAIHTVSARSFSLTLLCLTTSHHHHALPNQRATKTFHTLSSHVSPSPIWPAHSANQRARRQSVDKPRPTD